MVDPTERDDYYAPREAKTPVPQVVVRSSKTEISKLCAEALFLAMDQLPIGQWTHGTTFLPANVTTDTYGINRFKKMLADTVKLVLDSECTPLPFETNSDPSSVITYDVVAYNESWGGYGQNDSKDGFSSADEAIAYAKSCEPHLNATVWQRTKPKLIQTASVLLYDAKASLKANELIRYTMECTCGAAVNGGTVHTADCGKRPAQKTNESHETTETVCSWPHCACKPGVDCKVQRSAFKANERREYHANGTYWSGVPTVDIPCDFCGLAFVTHAPRTHACSLSKGPAQNGNESISMDETQRVSGVAHEPMSVPAALDQFAKRHVICNKCDDTGYLVRGPHPLTIGEPCYPECRERVAKSNRAECSHETLRFGSGDYYIFCTNTKCNARWGALKINQREYGFSADGVPIGCVPEVCCGVGMQLSGEERSSTHKITS